jgi:hypothetical protein
MQPELAEEILRNCVAYPGNDRIHIVRGAILTQSPQSSPDLELDGGTNIPGRCSVRCGDERTLTSC